MASTEPPQSNAGSIYILAVHTACFERTQNPLVGCMIAKAVQHGSGCTFQAHAQTYRETIDGHFFSVIVGATNETARLSFPERQPLELGHLHIVLLLKHGTGI